MNLVKNLKIVYARYRIFVLEYGVTILFEINLMTLL